MRLILAMIQVICLMAAQSTDYSNQSGLIRCLLWRSLSGEWGGKRLQSKGLMSGRLHVGGQGLRSRAAQKPTFLTRNEHPSVADLEASWCWLIFFPSYGDTQRDEFFFLITWNKNWSQNLQWKPYQVFIVFRRIEYTRPWRYSFCYI